MSEKPGRRYFRVELLVTLDDVTQLGPGGWDWEEIIGSDGECCDQRCMADHRCGDTHGQLLSCTQIEKDDSL